MVRHRSAETRSASGSASHVVPAAPHRGPADQRVLALQRSIGNRAVARLLARQPNVGVNADDRHVDVVSPDLGGVGDVDVGWYRRLNEAKLGGRLRVDPGNIYKDPPHLGVTENGL